ncbi:MAG: hypothetical protein QGI43_05675 [Gemmatimonadota bacterium]|nr:hypothetical protein [Gemmatimonadota bacterium]
MPSAGKRRKTQGKRRGAALNWSRREFLGVAGGVFAAGAGGALLADLLPDDAAEGPVPVEAAPDLSGEDPGELREVLAAAAAALLDDAGPWTREEAHEWAARELRRWPDVDGDLARGSLDAGYFLRHALGEGDARAITLRPSGEVAGKLESIGLAGVFARFRELVPSPRRLSPGAAARVRTTLAALLRTFVVSPLFRETHGVPPLPELPPPPEAR